jgi:hypothetical protein
MTTSTIYHPKATARQRLAAALAACGRLAQSGRPVLGGHVHGGEMVLITDAPVPKGGVPRGVRFARPWRRT